jgi:hypothetical protein
MKGKRPWLLVLPSLLLASCAGNAPSCDRLAGDFADLECRAISLRNTRFETANRMRFTEDTLLHPGPATDTARLRQRLDGFAKTREELLQQSLRLADTIKQCLDSFQRHYFKDKEEEADFNKKLNALLQQKGCR